MSAIVCGKRSIFEELTAVTNNSPPVSKRLRCSSSSPVRFSPPPVSLSVPLPHRLLIDQLLSLFPDMDNQVIERVLEECGDDLDSAIRSLNQLRLGSVDVNSNVEETQGLATSNAEARPNEDPTATIHPPMDGQDWVGLFVREMMSSSDINDARERASRALEALQSSICIHARAEAAKSFQQENVTLKEQLQALIHENTILKRAVAIQHERQSEFDDKNQELQQLKQLVSQYQEQLRTLEVNNYALTMHLKQAQQSNSIPGRFHPDVF